MQTFPDHAVKFPASVASFAVRLMSLNAHELSRLYADDELMRHMEATQLLMENRLQDIQAAGQHQHQQTAPKFIQQQHQHQQQQQYQHQLHLNRQLQVSIQASIQAAQQQQVAGQLGLSLNGKPHALSMSPTTYYQYYAQQQQQQQQQQHQQQQHHHQQQQQQAALSQQVAHIQQELSQANQHSHQQQHQQLLLLATCANNATSAPIAQQHQPKSVAASSPASSLVDHVNGSGGRSLQLGPPALDLRTNTPTQSGAIPDSPSPLGRAGSAGSGHSTGSLGQRQHPKKVKLSEYRKMQQLAENGGQQSQSGNGQQKQQLQRAHQNQHQHQHQMELEMQLQERLNGAATSGPALDAFHDQNRRPARQNYYHQLQQQLHSIVMPNSNLITTGTTTTSNGTNGLHHHHHQAHDNNETHLSPSPSLHLNNTNQNQHEATNGGKTSSASAASNGRTTNGNKKYKGEFDEPTPAEVDERLKELDKADNYHKQALKRGECACVLGSEFCDKSTGDVLQMIENWRQLSTEQRIAWKWDVNDLPKEIPLSDIKKFEDLRREFSDGRADFGGASKRKPLGIRGTRQFLLILYCLWGHPGRDDPMQRDGYCPHCLAKIKKANEQSTLVRVVNHFNMKHRRGANPRLSPQLDSSQQQAHVQEALMSVVEAAAQTAANTTADGPQHEPESETPPPSARPTASQAKKR